VHTRGRCFLALVDGDVAVVVQLAAELLGEFAARLGPEMEEERVQAERLASVELGLRQIAAVSDHARDRLGDDFDPAGPDHFGVVAIQVERAAVREHRHLRCPVPEVESLVCAVAIPADDTDVGAGEGRAVTIGAVKYGCAIELGHASDLGQVVAQTVRQDHASCGQYFAVRELYGEVVLAAIYTDHFAFVHLHAIAQRLLLEAPAQLERGWVDYAGVSVNGPGRLVARLARIDHQHASLIAAEPEGGGQAGGTAAHHDGVPRLLVSHSRRRPRAG